MNYIKPFIKIIVFIFCLLLSFGFLCCSLLITSGAEPTEENTVEVSATVKRIVLQDWRASGSMIYINEDLYGLFIFGYRKGSEIDKNMSKITEGTKIYYRVDRSRLSDTQPILATPAYSLRTDTQEVFNLNQYVFNTRRIIFFAKIALRFVSMIFLSVAIIMILSIRDNMFLLKQKIREF